MFHLSDKQLHILLGGLCGATFLLLCFFALFEKPSAGLKGELEGLSDYSQGWIASYQTTDAKLLQTYQQKNDNTVDNTIQQVVNLPATFRVEKGNTVTLTHKVPDMGQTTTYVVIDTKQEQISALIQGELLYESSEKEGYLPARHVIAIAPQYQNQILQIQLTGMERNEITLQGIYEGNYSQVKLSAWLENGYDVIVGGILILGSACFFVVWLLAYNRIRNKRPLLYSVMELFGIGCIFLGESRLVRMAFRWEIGWYLLEAAMFIIIAVVHILLVRSVTYKKHMLSLLDMGCLVCSIFYISVMVLQGFSLLHFDTIRILSAGLCIIIFVGCTVALGVSKRKDNRLILAAHGVLLSGMFLQMLHQIMQRGTSTMPVYMIAGCILYEGVVLFGTLWQALRKEKKEKQEGVSQDTNREQVIEEFNPNLLFAAFHTLQNLIKSGSVNSAKMLYYISVYFRDNLKAMKQPFEMIPFEEELEHILSYLTLQKTRNPNLSFAVECKVKEFRVPRRCIEPMVENAVVYGIAGKQDAGNVVVRTYERQEGYAIQIIDDGIGFEMGRFKKEHMTSLKVILDHLEQQCGAQTEVVSRPGKGTVITMILPVPDVEMEE